MSHAPHHISPFWRRFAIATAVLSILAAFAAGVAYNRAVDAAAAARTAAKVAARTADRAEQASDELCVRSRRFQPRIAKDFASRHIFEGQELRDYIATIPSTCPSDNLRGKAHANP
jgi:hypothetical protein